MERTEFLIIAANVMFAGYKEEIEWQRQLQECDNDVDFLMETCWVILNSGMREQVARKIWDRIKGAWLSGKDISTVFKHKGKVAAIKYVKDHAAELFASYKTSADKLTFLQTIPYIGKITCFHLAKNLGLDCVKPDRHLVRIAATYGTTPDAMCEKLAREVPEKKCVIDIVLWRAANLKMI